MKKEVCKDCKPLFEKLLKRIKKLEEKNCLLEKRLLLYENAHTPPSLQKKKKRIPRESSGKLGAPIGHPKYERPEPKITETKTYATKFCPRCSAPLEKPDLIKRQIEEEIPEPQPIKCVEHLIGCYRCKNCGKEVVSENDAPQGRFGKNAVTQISLLKYDDRLPLRKTSNSLDRHYKLKITHVGIFKVVVRVAKRLRGFYYEIILEIRSARVLYVDETEYYVNGETWWLWTFVSEKSKLFVIRKSRSKDVVEEVLGKKFEGIISCDGWRSYPSFSDKLQRCWAHILRESYELKDKHDSFEKFHDILCLLFDKIIEIRLKPPSEEKRREEVEKMKSIMLGMTSRMKKHKSFVKFAGKIENGIDFWFTCVIFLFVEPTNNFAEQALRELIVQRNIIKTLRVKKGAETLEVMASVIETWKKQGKPLVETMKSCL